MPIIDIPFDNFFEIDKSVFNECNAKYDKFHQPICNLGRTKYVHSLLTKIDYYEGKPITFRETIREPHPMLPYTMIKGTKISQPSGLIKIGTEPSPTEMPRKPIKEYITLGLIKKNVSADNAVLNKALENSRNYCSAYTRDIRKETKEGTKRDAIAKEVICFDGATLVHNKLITHLKDVEPKDESISLKITPKARVVQLREKRISKPK